MTIELYVFPPSPRAFKVLAVANHLEIPYTTHLVDLGKGDQRTPSYATLNPNMRMPTLKDGDFVLWEANAILQYLALQKPESGLLPTDERDRVNVTRWQFWDLAHWDSACAILIFENIVKPFLLGIDQPDPAALGRGEEAFHRAAKVLNGQLRDRQYVTGVTLTVADFSLGAALNHSDAAHLPVGDYAEIRRWYAGLLDLPAWQRTLDQTKRPVPARA
jgi:glutathione S-transferase